MLLFITMSFLKEQNNKIQIAAVHKSLTLIGLTKFLSKYKEEAII